MQLIDPICEANCKPHIGKPVCVVMVDGTTIYGTLGGLKGDKLTLRSSLGAGEGEEITTNQLKEKKGKGKKAQTKALGPARYPYPAYPYPGELVLDLALIALLFLIPFVWI